MFSRRRMTLARASAARLQLDIQHSEFQSMSVVMEAVKVGFGSMTYAHAFHLRRFRKNI